MKVADLIEELKKQDQDSEIYLQFSIAGNYPDDRDYYTNKITHVTQYKEKVIVS